MRSRSDAAMSSSHGGFAPSAEPSVTMQPSDDSRGEGVAGAGRRTQALRGRLPGRPGGCPLALPCVLNAFSDQVRAGTCLRPRGRSHARRSRRPRPPSDRVVPAGQRSLRGSGSDVVVGRCAHGLGSVTSGRVFLCFQFGLQLAELRPRGLRAPVTSGGGIGTAAVRICGHCSWRDTATEDRPQPGNQLRRRRRRLCATLPGVLKVGRTQP